MSLLTTLIEMSALEFNIELQLFPPIEGTTLYFLQEDGTTVNFRKTDSRAGMTTGWKSQTNKFQQQREILVAVSEAGFHAVIAKSTHLAIDNTVFAIDRGSTLPPSPDYPYYTIAVEATAETYTPI